MALPEFPPGEFYSCTDPESLTATDPWEAAEEHLDGWLDPKMTVAEVVAELGRRPLTVTAYDPGVVSDTEIKNWADSLTESLEEMFCDEHGNPDGDTKLMAEAEAIMLEAVTKIVKATRVWTCEEVGSVTLTGAQVVEWARKENPEWFKEPAPPPPRPVIRNLRPGSPQGEEEGP
jgi:hypothetical protein